MGVSAAFEDKQLWFHQIRVSCTSVCKLLLFHYATAYVSSCFARMGSFFYTRDKSLVLFTIDVGFYPSVWYVRRHHQSQKEKPITVIFAIYFIVVVLCVLVRLQDFQSRRASCMCILPRTQIDDLWPILFQDYAVWCQHIYFWSFCSKKTKFLHKFSWGTATALNINPVSQFQ